MRACVLGEGKQTGLKSNSLSDGNNGGGFEHPTSPAAPGDTPIPYPQVHRPLNSPIIFREGNAVMEEPGALEEEPNRWAQQGSATPSASVASSKSGSPPSLSALPSTSPTVIHSPHHHDITLPLPQQPMEAEETNRGDREKAKSLLEPIWSSTSWSCFSADELHAIEQIKQRLSTGYINILPASNPNDIDVLLQRKYTGNEPVIPATLADIPCSRFTVSQLLLCLNSLLYTLYDSQHAHLANLLQSYIDNEAIDFGTAYARLRTDWCEGNFEDFELKGRHLQEEWDGCRESLVKSGIIVSSRLPPRRMWDLYSNRVIHASLTMSRSTSEEDPAHESCIPGEKSVCEPRSFYAVSHSWVDERERQWVLSKVNRGEWRVPLPRDVSLEQVRVEILNLIFQRRQAQRQTLALFLLSAQAPPAAYAWMDLLCLRQRDKEAQGDYLRPQEHSIDVPTIGYVYQRCQAVVQYFCGLGRALVYGNEEGERHWLNRAWTLQELGRKDKAVTGGITLTSPSDPWQMVEPSSLDINNPFQRKFNKLQAYSTSFVFNFLLEMRHRSFTNPVDQIAGLLYPLDAEKVYVYNANETIQQAWEKLLPVLDVESILCITATFPFAGEGRFHFLPTWNQIQRHDVLTFQTYEFVPVRYAELGPAPEVRLSIHNDGHWHGFFPIFLQCTLTDSALPKAHALIPQGKNPRYGSITFTTVKGCDPVRDCIIPVGVSPGIYDLVLIRAARRPRWIKGGDEAAGHFLIGHWSPESFSFSKTAALTILRKDNDEWLLELPMDEQYLRFL
ncbi:hypothetical protein BKA70DRAFT_1308808 [Coprinopsis sp. MPI-PUGE-AT-0042]|nr:hypothetical protein BKA70DRAFT_1308808 [Coprinopsis sp. MPI-PUGE-AT-0042]